VKFGVVQGGYALRGSDASANSLNSTRIIGDRSRAGAI
jgi:hypothetical protein